MSLYDDPVNGLDDVSFGVNELQPTISNAGEVNGLGSLADELAGAFGDDYTEDEEEEYDEEEGRYSEDNEALEDRYDDTTTSTSPLNGTASPSKRMSVTMRRPSSSISDYDGSDYGDPDEVGLVESGISVGLEEKIMAIEKLALGQKLLLKEEDAVDGGAVRRLMGGLQGLGSQSTLETATTRLVTANSALSSNMLHQTRALRDLGFAINSVSLPAPGTTELLVSLIERIPEPLLEPLAELNGLNHLTLTLISQLSFLSDSLHMARQSSIAARRKLQAVEKACADWRNELEMVEKARRWIEDGDWDARCRRREAAVVCKDVTSGFEDVCKGFEEKLRGLEVAA